MTAVTAPSGPLTTSDRSRARTLASILPQIWPPAIVALAFVGAWSLLAVTVFAEKSFIVPPPWDVASAGWHNWDQLSTAIMITLQEAAAGFALAIIVGCGAATVMSQTPPLERSLYPYAVLLQTVPIVAIAPIIVLWIGFNQTSVIVVSFIISLFPILNNTLLGLKSTDRNQVALFELHTRARVVKFRKLRFPGAIPNVIAGLRISAGLSVVGAIVGEFIIGSGGTDGGLGVKVIYAQAQLDTDLLFAEAIAATALGFMFFLIVSYVGWLLLHRWHESSMGSEA